MEKIEEIKKKKVVIISNVLGQKIDRNTNQENNLAFVVLRKGKYKITENEKEYRMILVGKKFSYFTREHFIRCYDGKFYIDFKEKTCDPSVLVVDTIKSAFGRVLGFRILKVRNG